MILAPWKDPIPLTRGWCLFELYCTIIMNAKFEIAMSMNHMNEFFNDIINDTKGRILEMFGTINVENSDCFKKEDLEAIKEVVRKEVGFHKVNGMIFDKLRVWMIDITKAAVDGEEDIDRKLKLMDALGGVYQQQGLYDLSETIYQECLKQNKQLKGDNDVETLLSLSNLANLYIDIKNYEKAEYLYLEGLTLSKQVLGYNHIHTINTMGNLANIYKIQNKYDQSLALYLDVQVLQNQLFGTTHPNNFILMSNMADLYYQKQDYDQAEKLFIECINCRKQVTTIIYTYLSSVIVIIVILLLYSSSLSSPSLLS